MKTHFEITCRQASSDAEMFTKVINIGIDGHLEAFIESKFSVKDPRMQDARLVLNIAYSEKHILVRRLREFGTEESNQWADDIEAVTK